MHVRDQIVDAIADSLREAIPEASPRVYVHGRVDWDGQAYPAVVISATSTKVQIDNGMQRRETQVVVEIHEVEEAREDYVARLGDMSSRVEKAMADLPDRVPVEDVILISDTGVKDLDEDEDRLYAATASTFAVAYYTEAGDASRMIAPNY